MHMSELATYLAGQGHEVCVFTSMLKKDLFKIDYPLKFDESLGQLETEYNKNIIVRRFDPDIYLPRGKPATLQFLFEYSETLRRFKAKNRFDVMHWHSFQKGAIGLLMGSDSRTSNILTIHGAFYPVNDPFFYKRIFMESVLRKVDSIICISKETMVDALKCNVEESKLHLVPNWVDTSLFNPVNKRPSVDGVKCVLYVGRMVKEKGVGILIEALSDLLKEGVKVKGLMVGDGPDLPYFISLAKQLGIEKNVVFTGFVPLEEKVLYYSMADVFALLSIHEPQGRVLLEAMSAGVPVVAFKSAGIAEMIPSSCGILLENVNVNTAKDAIRELLSDERKTRKLQENARKLVVQNYDVKVVLSRIERIYESAKIQGSLNVK